MLKRLFLNERNVLGLIVLNAVVLFLLGFPHLPPGVTRSLGLLDDFITMLFVLELGVKVRALGFRDYVASGWNKLDLTLVLLSLPSLATHLLDEGAPDLDFLLVLRVCRVFKFFRFLRFIPGIEHMVLGVRRALRASVMILAGFFLALFMVSLISGRIFGSIDPDNFGDPLRSLYSIFKVFTIEGWFDVPDAVTENLSPTGSFFTRLFFILLLVGGGIFGLSLVNSIFVDAMVSDNNADLETKVDELTRQIALLRERLEQDGQLEEKKAGAGLGSVTGVDVKGEV